MTGVYECQHALWGGDGSCVAGDDDNLEARCECSDGFVNRNAFGQPSCVRRVPAVGGYVLVAFTGIAGTVFL